MNIIRFTSTYKPDGKDYTKVTLWNRYIQNKTLLFTLFIPTAAAIYFLVSDPGPFWWMFVLIMFYPLYSIIGFLFKIKKHLKFRNPADIAKTEFTFMNNGILADRMEMQKLDMIHWEDANILWELKDFFLLYQKDKLLFVFVKKDMEPEQEDVIREFILKHLSNRQGKTYKKSLFF
ncbi:MAG: hypothetical protein HFG39_09205 [Lachnospiraceae bacterium]|nr:hypothetical protein [Lachnospiraceae bacterium]